MKRDTLTPTGLSEPGRGPTRPPHHAVLTRALLPALLAFCLGACVPPSGAATCGDGVIDGRETDVDCGGADCPRCAAAALCLQDADCASGQCTLNRCEAASCGDGARNGDETDVDCGGACGPCAASAGCAAAADCESGVCTGGACVAASCTDGVRNAAEADVDCGGPCAGCVDGKACLHTADCATSSCVDGHCGVSCGASLLACHDACVNPQVDPNHCGACDAPCAAGASCVQGQCMPLCTGGTQRCGATCVDLGSNPAHCGGCDQPCAPAEVCAGGLCLQPCPVGQTACNGVCVSPDRDAQHCGGCNQPCAPGTACVGGVCSTGCPAPLLVCAGPQACVDPRNDPDHCNGCGLACPALNNALRACSNSACVLGPCAPGFDDCNHVQGDGCETDLGLGPSNCGACGRTCGGGDSCIAGQCCGALPAGSYTATCNNCTACDGVLTCLCDDASQVPRLTSLPYGACPSITNCNGVLQCISC